ncbi:conjugal transfer protein TraX [Pseudomonas fluorescens]|uniref:conjugal transfer protein TraX n=1 Tax=Pseudomonas fluorescens TaxID=294 RepID=UPI00223B7EB7|nr:conjugal transfer protein TraX [Pseudomonas fluorescens]
MNAYEPTAPVIKHRNAGQDLIKWLAMFTMVIDHLRLVWPEMGDLFIVGRLAFLLVTSTPHMAGRSHGYNCGRACLPALWISTLRRF